MSKEKKLAIEVLMPALSPTMEEGTLAKWFVKAGDKIESGDLLAEIETDKATMEFEAVEEGIIEKLLVAEGTEGVKVNSAIATLSGEDNSTSKKIEEPAAPKPVITDATDGAETNHLQFNIYNGGAAETPVYINYAGKVYIYNNDATNVGLRVRQDNASNTNYGIISQTDGTGTAGYFSTAGAGTALYGYCGGALYGVRGYSGGHYAG